MLNKCNSPKRKIVFLLRVVGGRLVDCEIAVLKTEDS